MKTVLIIAGILTAVYISYRIYRIYILDKGLDQLISKGAVILDVRTAGEYETGHIANSTNIALSKLRTDSIPFAKDQIIITCCSHGLRSVKAAGVLQGRGFTNVYNGGAWTDLQESFPEK